VVSKVEKIESASSTRPIHTNHSISITSEPDGVWVAHIQSAITAGLEKQGSANRLARESDEPDLSGGAHSDPHHRSEPAHTDPEAALPKEEHLSGESERIGSGNLEDDVPFGNHVGYL
jgi:hypothetical protein